MASVHRGRMRRRALLAGAAALAAVVAAGVWVGTQAWHVREELAASADLGNTLVDALGRQDLPAARVALDDLRTRTDEARSAGDGLLWRAFELVPWVGTQLAALRTVAAEADAVASGGIAPLLDTADALAAADGGALNAPALAAQRPALEEAASVWAGASRGVDALDTGPLLPPLADGVAQVDEVLSAGAGVVDGVARAAVVAPDLLGSAGPRNILVMLQNPAEARTGGGITGTFVELHAEGGVLTLGRQSDSAQFPWRSTPIAEVPAPTAALYGDVVGRFVQNATMTSDFALSARLASGWWQSAYGTTPNAVVALDPLVLAALLRAHGPVDLPDGSALTADDLVQRLLVDPYLTLDADAQTSYLAQVTGTVFAALTADVQPVTWVRTLAPEVAEGRVSVWSADPTVQAAIDGSAMGGMAERVSAAGPAAFGVYVNDATGGKMGTQLSVGIDAGFAQCADADGATAVIRVTLTNRAPADAASWPVSMTGGGLFGTAVGDIGTLVTVSAPPGAAFGGVVGADGPLLSANAVDGDRPSSAVRVNVSPGETESVDIRFVLPQQPDAAPRVVHTPLVDHVAVGRLAADTCS